MSLAAPLCHSLCPLASFPAFYGPFLGLLPNLDDQVVLYPQSRLKIVVQALQNQHPP